MEAIPWRDVAIDIVSGFPASRGYTCILVVTDRFSKMVHLIPFGDDTTAETMARQFYAEVVRLHGLPSSIISDRDPRWMSAFWTDLFRLMGVELKRSTAFHPETDG